MSEFIAKIKAILDTSGVEKQINDLQKNRKIRIEADSTQPNKTVKQVDSSIRDATKATRTFGNTLRRSFDIGTAATITAAGFNAVRTAARDAKDAITDFDGAITQLRMATGENYAETMKLVKSYNAFGKMLGATTTEMTDGADAWLRQGHSIKDTNTLIRDSMILSKVANLDSADSTKYLTSAMKAYGIAVEDVLGVVDKLTSVDVVSAVDAGGLAEGMSKTAITAKQLGVELDELVAYLAVIGETTQDTMSSVGNALKTVFSRMANIKSGKLQFIDEDGTIELLSDVEIVLNNLGIQLRDNNNEFRDASIVLRETAEVWDKFGTVQQASISKSFAGVRHAEKFRALMENYSLVQKYVDVSANSMGSAEKKFSAYLDSIEAKTKSLQAAFESLSFNAISTESIDSIIDATTVLITFLDQTNLVKGVLTGGIVAGSVKMFSVLASAITHAEAKMNALGQSISILKAGNIGKEQIQQLAYATSSLSDAQLKTVLSSSALTTQQRIAILTAQGMSKAEAQAALAAMKLATSEGTATAATVSFSGVLKGLWTTLKANPLILVASAVTAAVSVYSTLKQRTEEAREASLEAGRAAKEEADKIRDLYNAYSEAKSAYDGTDSSKQTLKSTSEELLAALGLERSEIEKLTEDYDGLAKKIDEITTDTLQSKLTELTAGYSAAQKTLLDKAEDGVFSSFGMLNFQHGKNGRIFADTLRDAGVISAGSYGSAGGSIYLGDNSTIEGTLALYQKLLDMRDALNAGVTEGLYSREDLAGSELFSGVNAKITQIETEAKEVLDYIDQINEATAMMDYIAITSDTGIPETQAEFDALKQSMIDAALAGGNYVGTQEDMTDAVTNFLNSIPAFSKFFTDITEEIVPPEIKKLSFADLIADTDSDNDFIDQVTSYREAAEDLQGALEKLRAGEEVDLPSLYEQFPELAGAEDLEQAIVELLGNKATELGGIFDTYYESLDTSVEGSIPAFYAYRNAVLALFNTAEEGTPIFASLADAMEGVGNASSLIENIQKEMAETGSLSFDTLQSIVKQFGSSAGEYFTISDGKINADIEKIKEHYVQLIRDMKLESPELEQALIDALDAGFDESQFDFDALSDAMSKAQQVASVAAESQEKLTYDSIESLRELFGADFEKYINKDVAGNYLSVNTEALKEYARGLLVAENATEGTLAQFDAMWENTIAGSTETTTALERVTKALNNVGSVSDYLTLLQSDDLNFMDALSSAVKLLDDMPEEYSLENFFTFGDDGSIEYHTEFLTEWINGYLDKMVDAGDITQDYADQMKNAAKAEAKQTSTLKKLTDAMGDVGKAANLMKDAQEEAAENGSNSLDTILSLYEQFGDKANDMLKITEDGGLVIDTEAIKQEMLRIIDTIDGITPEIRQKMEDALNVKLDDKEEFYTQVDAHVESIKKLQNALADLREDGLSNGAVYDLTRGFPELNKQAENLEEGIIDLLNSMNADTVRMFAAQFGKVESEEDRKELQAFMDIVLKLGEVVGNTKFAIDIAAEAEGMEQLFDAIKESVSSTGLSVESIDNLYKRYEKIDGFNPAQLFEKTANGIHLNTSALRSLENEYEKFTKQNLDDDLNALVAEYNSLTEQIDEAGIVAGTTDLYARRNDILNQINETSELAAQYVGLTSAFYKWEQAQSMGEEGDMYDSLTGGLENIGKLYEEGLVGTNKFRTAVQLMTNQDMSTASVEELMAAYEKGYPKMQRYFQDSSDGVLYFLNDLKKLNSEWVSLNDDGSWDINFGIGNDQEIADALGINVEAVQSIMRKLSDYGFDINLDSVYADLDTMTTKAEKAAQTLKDMERTDYSFNVNSTNIERINEQINEAEKILAQFKNEDGTVNLSLEGAEEAKYLLASLIMQKQSLDKASILKIDASNVDGEIGEVLRKLQDIQTKHNDIQVKAAIGADTTQLQSELDAAIVDLGSANAEILATLGIDTKSKETIIATVSAITPEVIVKCGVDPALVTEFQESEHDAEGTVIYKVDDASVKSYQPERKDGYVRYTAYMESWNPPTKYGTVYYTVRTKGSGYSVNVDGTAHAQGTAYAHGDWGTKNSGYSLGGELGRELVVRDGKFFTIGEESAEFFQYKKGDIIFNAAQTEEIFEKGKITNAAPRGKAFSSGSGTITGSGSVITKPSKGSGSGSSSGSSKNDGTDQDEPKVFDWIEIALNRIQRTIEKFATTASSTFKTLRQRLNAASDQIDSVNKELILQERAHARYLQEADSVGLSENIAVLVRNGAIDISEYDADTAELIGQYQDWYEKALDCSDAIGELREELSALYQERFDTIATDFDNQLDQMEHRISTFSNAFEIKEAQGFLGGSSLYSDMRSVEMQKLAKNQKKLLDLQRALNQAVSSGSIDIGSESWYEMQAAINETKEAIQESNLAIIEYGNSIRDLDWSHFDYLQSRISQITGETEFLIGLLENDKLYNDHGKFTNAGMATVGMRGINYNTYLAQADKYAGELRDIQEDLEDDPYDTALIERREELLRLQRESISAAEDEKQAIIDMVEEGINLELDSLNELIETYKESLNGAKNLYDYQKKISSQTSEIASLQKQLSAYSGDTSEENRARLQKLQVSLAEAQDKLEESQYDQYIKDQTELLDEFYENYETVLNERLDNVDALIADMIEATNANADSIANTIIQAGSDVGYTLTSGLNNILSGDGSMIAEYGAGFSSQLTTLNSTVHAIEGYVAAMINAGDTPTRTVSSAGIGGFSSGGYVAELQKIAMRNGDDMITVNTLKAGEAVLTESQLGALSSVVDDASYLYKGLNIPKHMDGLSAIPEQTGQSISQQFGDLNIEIDHVEDYNDFVTQLRDDPKFEKMVQAMTTDLLSGKGELSKYKYRWK